MDALCYRVSYGGVHALNASISAAMSETRRTPWWDLRSTSVLDHANSLLQAEMSSPRNRTELGGLGASASQQDRIINRVYLHALNFWYNVSLNGLKFYIKFDLLIILQKFSFVVFSCY